VDADGIVITTGDDLRTGHVRISKVDEAGLTTGTGLAFAPIYDGAYVADPEWTAFVPIREVRDWVVAFVEPRAAAAPFEVGGDAWIVNVGPGDRMEIPQVSVWP